MILGFFAFGAFILIFGLDFVCFFVLAAIFAGLVAVFGATLALPVVGGFTVLVAVVFGAATGLRAVPVFFFTVMAPVLLIDVYWNHLSQEKTVVYGVRKNSFI